MINILLYIGMSLHSEVCLWTLLGLVRTIFDATLFKVNANLKQVWQMSMPDELSLPVQRMLRTMISGVMLVQCFTVYVYLASYIVLLYPVFLEERPTLVLPWLLLAAIRKLLCELTSLALGLGTCVLLGPARPSCIKFLIIKVISITPAFYMWMLVFSYYRTLKVASAFKTFPVGLPRNDHDYGLEMAIRRRRTKSLLDEEQLRRKLGTTFYTGGHPVIKETSGKSDFTRITQPQETSNEDDKNGYEILQPLSATSNRMISDIGCYEDWFGNEVRIPRDTDRILEQFCVMMLRIGVYINNERNNTNPCNSWPLKSAPSCLISSKMENIGCTTLPSDDTETPLLVGNSKRKTASYLQEYPQIFMKKHSELRMRLHSQEQVNAIRAVCSHNERDSNNTNIDNLKMAVISDKNILSDTEDVKSQTGNITNNNRKVSLEEMNSKLVVFKSKKTNLKLGQNAEKNIIREPCNEDLQHESTSIDSLQSIIDYINKLPTNRESYTTDKTDTKAKDSSSDRSSDSLSKTSLLYRNGATNPSSTGGNKK